MRTHSISQAIVLKSGLLVSLVLIATAVLGYWLIARQLEQSFDQTMVSKAQILVTQVKEYTSEVEFDFADEFMPEYQRESDPEYFQLWMDGSGVFERSNSLAGADLPLLDLQHEGQKIQDMILPDGRSGRSVQIYFVPQIQNKEERTPERIEAQKWMNLVIARERASLDGQLASVATTILLVVLAILFIVLYLIHRSVQSGLKPLLRLQQVVSKTNIDNLDERVDIGHPPDELEALVDQFNSMAHRISESVKRERRFSADVAHELKTPIAELLNMAEVSLRWPDKVDDTQGFYRDVLDSSTAMQNIVTKLLMLSRCENGQVVLEPEELSISEVLEALVKRAEAGESKRNISVETRIDSDFVFMASRTEFELIIQNLLGNALQYSPDDGTVLVKVWVSGVSGHVSITNFAPELNVEDTAVMFDRLWRKDEVRNGEMNAGLGLALVAAFSSLLGIAVTTSLDDDKVFTVHLSNLAVM